MLLFLWAVSGSIHADFRKNYRDSRQAFQKIIEKIPKAEKGHWKIPYKIEDLFVDWAFLPPSKQKENLIVLLSGVHGIESFATTALQRALLQNANLWTQGGHTGLLIIHGLNPYGHKYSRRVTENNVDLNRNFFDRPKDFQDPNTAYIQFESFLNPKRPLKINLFSLGKFVLQALFYLFRHSMQDLRQAILQGQYSFPKGIFYGGSQLQPHGEWPKKLLQEKGHGFKKYLFVDLHTGYGKKGHLHILPNFAPEKKHLAERMLQDLPVNWKDDKDFYTVTGDSTSFALTILKGQFTLAVTFEHGTLDSQTTTGSIDSLRRIVWENQSFWYGQTNEKSKTKMQKLFQEMFHPSDITWQKNALEQSRKSLNILVERLKNLKIKDNRPESE